MTPPHRRPRMPWRFASVVLVFLSATALAQQVDKPAADNDPFGVAMLFPTADGGREWRAAWDERRTIRPYQFDPQDPVFRNSAGAVVIDQGVATALPGQVRFYVLTPKVAAQAKDAEQAYSAPLWKNVEMTAYVRCGEPTQTSNSQALVLSARSGERHSERDPCDGTSYHATLRFDGKCGFKKEIWHTGGYTDLQPSPAPKPWSHVPLNEWIGIKFVCRNCDQDKHVKLQLFRDLHEANDWRQVAEFTDAGGWEGRRAGCDRPRDKILTEAYPAVYFRTDHVPVEVKKFSMREVAPLP